MTTPLIEYTPGPWELWEDPEDGTCVGSETTLVAEQIARYADACLIVRAPAMAAALQWLLDELGDPASPKRPSVDAMAAARAAITR